MKKTFRNIFLVMLAAVALVLTGCGSETATVAEEGTVGEISGADLEEIQQDNDEKEKYMVVDIRPEEEYDSGNLKHAINIPAADLESEMDRLREEEYTDLPIIVYGNTAEEAQDSAQLLVDNDFPDVAVAEGVDEFDGYDLVLYESTLIDDTLASIENQEDFIFIDARDQEDFDVSAFPGAIKADPENPEAIISELPEDTAQEIMVYCYSGNRSAGVATAIADAGYENVYNALFGTGEYEDYPLEEK